MNSQSAVDKLVERLLAATGPDDELDALIRCAIYAPADAFVEQSPLNGAWCIYHGTYGGRPRLFERPHRVVSQDAWKGSYTASIDAALTLVPEGANWRVDYTKNSPDRGKPYLGLVWFPDAVGFGKLGHSPANGAIALCIAALRSRTTHD